MKNSFRTIAVATALAIGTATLPLMAFAAPAMQEHHDDAQAHPEYTSNKYYKIGNREGYQDHQKNVQRPDHKHAYRNDTDRKAHDYGYQQGFSGTSYNHH